ncbi:MAG: flagellar export chaperone FliS [Firmicutes bacterium]|nr:flagellar export chaperone FliS [Bacillota bacterium]
MYAHAYQQYRQTQVETAGPGQLILMLYNGGIRFCSQAMGAIERGQLEEAHKALVRSQQIVDELMAALDLETGELAQNLMRLYEYMNQCLLQANMKKDLKTLAQVRDMFTELRDTWQTMLKSGRGAGPGRAVL